MDKTVRSIFWLMALLVVLAYFAGFAADVNAIAGAGTKLSYALTGRNAQGNFAAYPTGG